MRVLVTGAGGFVGSVVVRRLAATGHDVQALVRGELTPRGPQEGPGVRVVRGDLAAAVGADPVDVVVHAAASIRRPGTTVATLVRDNAAATANLVEWAVRTEAAAMVLLSSTSVYGNVDGPVVAEDAPTAETDAYGATKRLAELLVLEAAGALAASVLRLPGVVGPDASAGPWLTRVVAAAAADRDVEVHNGAAPFNAVCHVDDVAAIVERLLDRRGGPVVANVGASEPLPVRAVAARVVAGLGSSSRIIERESAQRPYVLATDVLEHQLGVAPRAVSDVLDRYLSWAVPLRSELAAGT